ncbi:MAG: hypothetical protein E7668_01370 [Ruminococcaceae bacterium]|nr:hypothetical protein [Oscillospiraceae bacterium]
MQKDKILFLGQSRTPVPTSLCVFSYVCTDFHENIFARFSFASFSFKKEKEGAFLASCIPFFVKFGRIHKARFFKKFSIPPQNFPLKPMENSVDNVENLAKSRLF